MRKVFVNGAKAQTYFSAGQGIPGLLAAAHLFRQIAGASAEVLDLEAQCLAGGSFWVEFKDGHDKVRRRFRINLAADPSFRSWRIPLSALGPCAASELGLIVLADFTADTEFRRLRVAPDGAVAPMFSNGVNHFPQARTETPRVDIFGEAVFDGGGKLWTDCYGLAFEPGVGVILGLGLGACDGYIFTTHPPANLCVHRWLVMRVKTPGGGLFLESKNQAGELVTPSKVRLDFPSSSGQDVYYAMDLSSAPTATGHLVASLIALSDPESMFEIADPHYAIQQPPGSVELKWDGRRFSRLPPHHFMDVPFRDLLWEINLSNRGMALDFTNVLTIGTGLGFAFGFTSPFDLLNADQNPFLDLVVRTRGGASFFLELKGNSGGLAGEISNGNYKLPVTLPDTHGQFRMVTIPLAEKFVPSVRDRFVRQIAFSDAVGTVDIAALGLSASPLTDEPRASVKITDEGAVLFTGYGGQAEASADLGTWQILQEFQPHVAEPDATSFFRIRATP